MRISTPNNRAFTLIELMIVVAIIGILAAIAVPKFANLVNRSKDAATLGALGSIRSALSIYYASVEGHYPTYPDGTDISETIQVDIAPFLNTEQINIEFSSPGCRDLGGVISEDLTDGPPGTVYMMAYDGNPSRGTWGKFVFNCLETDTKGNIWSSY